MHPTEQLGLQLDKRRNPCGHVFFIQDLGFLVTPARLQTPRFGSQMQVVSLILDFSCLAIRLPGKTVKSICKNANEKILKHYFIVKLRASAFSRALRSVKRCPALFQIRLQSMFPLIFLSLCAHKISFVQHFN